MVSLNDFSRQVQQARQNVEQRKAQLSQQEREIAEREGRLSYQSELRNRSFEDRLKRRAQLSSARGEISNQLKEIQSYESEILNPTEEVLARQQQSEENYRVALKAQANSKGVFLLENKEQREIYRRLKSNEAAQKEYQQQLRELREQGITPVFVKGKVAGYYDEVSGQSVELSKLPQQSIAPISAQSVKKLEASDLIGYRAEVNMTPIPKEKPLGFRVGEILKKGEQASQKALTSVGEFVTRASPEPTRVPPASRVVFGPAAFASEVVDDLEVKNRDRIILSKGSPTNNQMTSIIAPARTQATASTSTILESREPEYISLSERGGLILSPKASGDVVKSALDVGSFFVPVVSGVRATSYISSLVGKKLTNEPVGALESLGGALIVVSATPSIVRKIVPPKITTRYVTSDIGSVSGAKGTDVYFKSATVSDVKGPFIKERFYSGSLTQTRFLSGSSEKAPFISGSVIATRKTLNKGFSAPTGSVSAQVGVAKAEDLSLRLSRAKFGRGTIEATSQIESGFRFLSVGKSKSIDNKKVSEFITGGFGGKVSGDSSFIYGRAVEKGSRNVFSVRGADDFLGVSKVAKEPRTSTQFLTRGGSASKKTSSILETAQKKSDELPKILTQEIQKQEITRAIKSQIKNPSSTTFKVTSASASVLAPAQQPVSALESIYYGKGQYERTETEVAQLPTSANKEKQDSASGVRNLSLSVSASASDSGQIFRNVPDTRIRIDTGTVQITPMIFRQPSIVAQDTGTKQRPRQPSPPRTIFPFQLVPTTKSNVSASRFGFGAENIARSWDVYVKEKGKYRKISDNLPRNLAEKTGADYVIRNLSARFKLVADSGAPRIKKDISYEPDPAVFRNYAIRKNRQIPLRDEWIQKSGSKREPTRRGARLRSRGEVGAILGIKRRSGRFFL